MAVVSIKELSGKSGGVNSSFQRNYTRTWVVVTDNAADGPFVIGSTAGLPLIYDPYPEDVRAFCVSLNVSQDGDNPQVFRVEASYAYNIDASFGTGSPIPIVNTADCPLNPPLYVDVPALTLTIGLNAVTGPSAAWAESVGCLNANQIVVGGYTIAKDHAMLRAVSANSVFEEGQKYWRWQIVFEIRPDWDFVDDSRGLMAYQWEKDVGGAKVKSPKPKPIKRNNSTITQPVLLDGDGFEASVPSVAATLRFKIRNSKVFPTPL